MNARYLFLALLCILGLAQLVTAVDYYEYVDHELIRSDLGGVSYTPVCTDMCHLPVRINIDLPMTLTFDATNLAKRFTYSETAAPLVDSGINILVNNSYKESCNKLKHGNGTAYISCVIDGAGNQTRSNYSWTPFTGTWQIDGQKDYYFDLWGQKDGALVDSWVDAIPRLYGHDLPYAYWTSSTIKDTYLVQTAGGLNNYGARPLALVGCRGDAGQCINDNLRFIVGFNLSGIPAGATITNANVTWQAYFTDEWQVTHTIYMYGIARYWKEGTANPSAVGNASWNYSTDNLTMTDSWDGVRGLNSNYTTKTYGSKAIAVGSHIANHTFGNGNNNLTEYIQGALNGTYHVDNDSIISFLFVPDVVTWTAAGVDDDLYITTKEGAANQPRIAIEYSVTGVGPTVTLHTPINQSNWTYNIPFNCSATDSDDNVANITLYIDNVKNYTLNHGTSQFVELYRKLNVSEGTHYWWCNATDANNNQVKSSIFNFSVDQTAPYVDIVLPSNTTYISYNPTINLSLNFTAIDSAGHISTCVYWNETANITIPCGSNSSLNFSAGSHRIVFFANDSLGYGNWTAVSFTVRVITLTMNYTTPVPEGSLNYFALNLSNTLPFNSLTANFSYNNTLYPVNITNTSVEAIISSWITAPNVGPSTDAINFSVNYTLDGVGYLTANYTQDVSGITPGHVNATGCLPGFSAAFYVSFFDEQNKSRLYNYTVEYIYRYGYNTSNITFDTITNNITNVEGYYLCFNSSQINNLSLGYGEAQYAKSGWAENRYYWFYDTQLNNITDNYTLYSLNSNDATSFLFSIEDTTLDAYEDKYVALLRWYPDDDNYYVTSMGRTDDDGQTVFRVETEDADYRVAVYELNGSLISLANPVRMLCLESPCEYTLTIDERDTDYMTFSRVTTSLTYNSTQKFFTLIYSDEDQDTSGMVLTVWKLGGRVSTMVCNNSAVGYTGVITCNLSSYSSGTFRAIAYRLASPGVPIAEKIVEVVTSLFRSNLGLFMSFSIFVSVIGVAVGSPTLIVTFGIASLLPAFIFKALSLQILIGIIVVGGLILHFLRRNTG